jgi:hypothetical protein
MVAGVGPSKAMGSNVGAGCVTEIMSFLGDGLLQTAGYGWPGMGGYGWPGTHPTLCMVCPCELLLVKAKAVLAVCHLPSLRLG